MKESARAEAAALVTQAAAEEILAILGEQMELEESPALWTPHSMISMLVAAAWRASQSKLWPMAPADYVALMRSHADSVERLHCWPKKPNSL